MVIVMDEKTIVDTINKGIDDFNDQCMTMGINSKAYHITNIECEEIKMNNMIECKTDREKMLCEQVLRMCRGEKSQIKCTETDIWYDFDEAVISHLPEYRAKPKKELVVPWEFINDEIIEITFTKDNSPYCKTATHHHGHVLQGLKLDLEGIDLPVTVKRPEVK